MEMSVYVYFAPENTRVTRTVQVKVDGLHTPVNVDLGPDGSIIGVEVLDGDRVHVNGHEVEVPPERYYRWTEAGFVREEDDDV
jgi:hypothetical protein